MYMMAMVLFECFIIFLNMQRLFTNMCQHTQQMVTDCILKGKDMKVKKPKLHFYLDDEYFKNKMKQIRNG